MTGRSLERAETRLEGEGFKIGEPTRSRRAKPMPETVLEQDPIPGEVDEELRVPHLLLLEAGGDPHRQHRPRQRRRSPRPPAWRWARRPTAIEEAGFEVQVDRVNSDKVDEGLVDPLRPLGRLDR